MDVELKSSLKKNIILLQFCAIWPVKTNNLKASFTTYRIFLALLSFIYNLTEIIYIFQNARSMKEIASSCYITVWSMEIVIKALIFISKQSEIETVITGLDIAEFQPKNELQRKITEKVMWISNLMVPLIVTMVSLSFVTYISAFFLADHRGLLFFAWFPYNVSSSFQVFMLTFLFQVVTAATETYASFGMDSVFSILMLHIGGQCDLICEKLMSLRATKDLRGEMNGLIDHYQKLVMYFFWCLFSFLKFCF